MKKVIEFVGLPTSGKSTLSKTFYEDFINADISCEFIQLSEDFSILNVIFIMIKSIFLKFDFRILFSLISIFFNNDCIEKKRLILLFLNLEKLKQSKNNWVIFEEGIIQNVWSLIRNNNCNINYALKLLDKYLKSFDVSIIWIPISLDVFKIRINERKKLEGIKKNYYEFNDSELEQFYIRSIENFNLILRDIQYVNIENTTLNDLIKDKIKTSVRSRGKA